MIRIFENDEAMGQALRTGEIDFATGPSATLFDTVTMDPTITGHVADGAWWNDLAFNFGGQDKTAANHPAIKDVTVRLLERRLLLELGIRRDVRRAEDDLRPRGMQGAHRRHAGAPRRSGPDDRAQLLGELEAYRNDRFTGFQKTPDNEAGTLLLSAYDTRTFRASSR